MPDTTPRLHLPFLMVGQAQKELTHNEALARLDICVQTVAEDIASSPPQMPEIGQCWLIGPNPRAAWTGHEGAVAQWAEGGWRFVSAFEGFTIWMRATGQHFVHESGSWTASLHISSLRIGGQQVIGPQQGAVSPPIGGSVADVEARSSIVAIIAALQAHGLISN